MMKSKRVWGQSALVVLVITGLLVTYAFAQSQASPAACCGSTAKVAAAPAASSACCGGAQAACASTAPCASTAAACDVAAKQCPVSQFMARLHKVDLTEAQIGQMMGIWKVTEKKLLGVLTAEQLVQMNKTVSTPKQVAAKAACCGTCGGSCSGLAAKTAATACPGTCAATAAQACCTN